MISAVMIESGYRAVGQAADLWDGEPAIELALPDVPLRDLAPMIHRQRLVIEGTPRSSIGAACIREYLTGLSRVCAMTTLIEPVTHRSDRFGWAGWIHWETSGAHFYAWDVPTLFFSVDIYTCKPFDPLVATRFTAEFFDVTEIVAKEF